MQLATFFILFVAANSIALAQPWIPEPNPQQDWMSWIWTERFQANVEYTRINGSNINVLFYGDSITEGWDYMARSTWDSAYAPLGAANYGIGGDGTQHVLWRIINGEVDNISPRLIVLKIGTNNIGWYAEADIARGVITIVDELRHRLPNTKILLLGILPRYNSEQTAITDRINALFAHVDNGNTIRYLNMRDAFYVGNDQFYWDLFSTDLLHLATPGYERWEQTMNPLFTQMWNTARPGLAIKANWLSTTAPFAFSFILLYWRLFV